MPEKCYIESIKRQKNVLRKQVLEKRDRLSLSFRQTVARRIAHFSEVICPTKKEVIAGFLPIRSEIDPRLLMSKLALCGNRLALPAIVDKRIMVFRLFEKSTALINMPFSTQGPSELADEIEPKIILLPLAVFDGSGNRIGYGGGYYDYAITIMRKHGLMPYLVGLAYECQRMDVVPVEPHDRMMNAVLTEDGLQTFS